MAPRPLTENEMLTWEAAVDKHEKEIFKNKHVRGVGVGYRIDTRLLELKDEVCITIAVDNSYYSLPQSKRKIKLHYGFNRLPAQIVPLPKQELEAALPFWKLAEPVDPIVGGAEIGNGNLCKFNAGSLGAIVFNSKGERLGLCVQHVIGDDSPTKCTNDDCPACSAAKKQSIKNKLSDWALAPATKGDPICQPNWNPGNEIGELLDFDKGYDAAVFKLNDGGGRRVEAKINGFDGEIAEPILPPLGMNTVFRGTKSNAKAQVAFLMRVKYTYPKKSTRGKSLSSKKTTQRVEVWMNRIGKSSTKGGDCGGIWVSDPGRHPVGMHTGKHRYSTHLNRNGIVVKKEIEFFKSTSMSQLVREFHRFSFSPLCYKKLLKQKSKFYTRFVEAPDSKGFFALCCTTTGLEPLKVWKYDDAAKPVKAKKNTTQSKPKKAVSNSDVEAYNGVGAACLGNHLYAVWRSMTGDLIKMARWNHVGERTQFSQKKLFVFPGTKTVHSPSLISHKNRLFMAFVDPKGRVCLRISDGTNWNVCRSGFQQNYFGRGAASAPTLASYKNKLFIAWKYLKKVKQQYFSQIKLVEVNPSLSVSSQRVSTIVRAEKLPAIYAPAGDIDMTVSQGTSELVLAYSEPGGGLNSIALAIAGNWVDRPWRTCSVIQHECLTDNPPTLFTHDGRVICARELRANHS